MVVVRTRMLLSRFHIIKNILWTPQKAKGKAAAVLPKNKSGKKKKVQLKFSIDCSKPVEDGIMNVTDFVSVTRSS